MSRMQTVDDSTMDAATSSQSPPPQSSGPIEDRFKVYNPQLYRELLGASDWSQTIEKTRKAKREALLAQHNDEEKAAMARRAEQELKAKEERETIAAERRRQKLADREERDLQDFQDRTRRFFADHEVLMEQLGVLESDSTAHEARVRERLYRQWESDVFLPVQTEVNRQIENRAREASSMPNPVRGTAQGSAVSRSPLTSTRLNDPAQPSGSWSAPSAQQPGASAAATWAASKESMWRDFLDEGNRRRRGHEKSGLFLHDDPLTYDPAGQREATTIRYQVPTRSAVVTSGNNNNNNNNNGGALVSSVDQSRATAQALEAEYERLAQQFQMDTRASRTTTLARMPGGAHDHTSTRRLSRPAVGPQSTLSRAVDATTSVHHAGPALPPAAYQHDTVRVAYRVSSPNGRHRSTVEEAALSELVPRTHMPYDLAHNAIARVQATGPRAGASAASTAASGRAPAPGSASAALMAPSSYRELVATYAGAAPHDPVRNRTAAARVGAVVDDLATRWTAALEETTTGHAGAQRLLGRNGSGGGGEPPSRAMPLPLPGGDTARRQHEAQADSVWARGAQSRGAYLPTTEWGSDRFPSTIYGHYVHSDGSALEPSDRKVAEGAMKTENTTVLFDHYDYPKGMQPQHYGKRMEVWRQV